MMYDARVAVTEPISATPAIIIPTAMNRPVIVTGK